MKESIAYHFIVITQSEKGNSDCDNPAPCGVKFYKKYTPQSTHTDYMLSMNHVLKRSSLVVRLTTRIAQYLFEMHGSIAGTVQRKSTVYPVVQTEANVATHN